MSVVIPIEYDIRRAGKMLQRALVYPPAAKFRGTRVQP